LALGDGRGSHNDVAPLRDLSLSAGLARRSRECWLLLSKMFRDRLEGTCDLLLLSRMSATTPTPPRCTRCGTQFKLAACISDPKMGDVFKVFQCQCGDSRWAKTRSSDSAELVSND
jgi:hypothetical protein